MKTPYTERGGGWVAGSPWHLSVSATWPFARIQVMDEQVFLNVGWVKFGLPYSEIKEVKRIFILPFIADGVRIIHTKNDTPKWLVFWSLGNAKKLTKLIQAQKAL